MSIAEVFWTLWECPEDDCMFVFRVENILVENDGLEMVRAIALLHVRQTHPGLEVNTTVNVRDARPDKHIH